MTPAEADARHGAPESRHACGHLEQHDHDAGPLPCAACWTRSLGLVVPVPPQLTFVVPTTAPILDVRRFRRAGLVGAAAVWVPENRGASDG